MSLPPQPDSGRDASADQEETQRYLELLRDGTRAERIKARDWLASVFETRGMIAEAVELCENNMLDGVRDRALYERLASLYWRQGRLDLADEVLLDLEKLERPNEDPAPVAPPPSAPELIEDELTESYPAMPEPLEEPPPRAGAGRAALLIGVAAVIAVGTAAAFALAPRGELLGVAGTQKPMLAEATMAPTPALAAQASPLVSLVPPSTSPEAAAASPTLVAEAAGCTFVLGFAALRQAAGPDVVGECVENQQFVANGDARQPTTKGEMVWRKADNVTGFTDGGQTWLLGPNGLQKRANADRFEWESGGAAAARPTSTPFPLPPALPGSVLPSRRVVTYYGNPLATAMGILGEVPPQQMLARLRQQVEAYAKAAPDKLIQPALELVAIVAQAGPGADGMYRLKMDTELIEEVAGWAESNGCLLILDVQVGRSSVVPEVQSLIPFLRRPYVHLALDPEFAMSSTQVPGDIIGTHDATDVNRTIRILADLVTAEQLPPKLLIVHRFTERMLTNYRQIQPDPRVQVAVVMDGFGAPELKTKHYEELVRDQRVQYLGFKLFYKQDKPVMTPEQVLELDPPPDVVIYQ
jgi:hypothetical protein